MKRRQKEDWKNSNIAHFFLTVRAVILDRYHNSHFLRDYYAQPNRKFGEVTQMKIYHLKYPHIKNKPLLMQIQVLKQL